MIAAAALVLIAAVGFGAALASRGGDDGNDGTSAQEEAVSTAATANEELEAESPSPPPPSRDIGFGGSCNDSNDCRAGACIGGVCSTNLSPDLWVTGNRWVFRKTSHGVSEEHRTYSYRYAREVMSSTLLPNGDYEVGIRIVGGTERDGTVRFLISGGCMYDRRSDEDVLYWCLPTAPNDWSWQSFHGNDTSVARFVSETDYDTRISAELGWVEFSRQRSDRTSSYVVEEYRVGNVRTDGWDANPPLCDWDDHDTRIDDADFVRAPRNAADRALAAAVRHARAPQEFHVDTRSGTWPSRLYAVTDGSNTWVPSGTGSGTHRVSGRVRDLGSWLDPATAIEHVVIITDAPGGPRLAHMSSRSGGLTEYRLGMNGERIEPDPWPTLDGCVMRVAVRDDDTSRVADFDVSSGHLRRTGDGSLQVY